MHSAPPQERVGTAPCTPAGACGNSVLLGDASAKRAVLGAENLTGGMSENQADWFFPKLTILRVLYGLNSRGAHRQQPTSSDFSASLPNSFPPTTIALGDRKVCVRRKLHSQQPRRLGLCPSCVSATQRGTRRGHAPLGSRMIYAYSPEEKF